MPARTLAAVVLAAAALVGSSRGVSAEPVPVEDAPAILESSANTAPSVPATLEASGAIAGSSRYVALSPTRILDSRDGPGMPAGVARKLNGWETIPLQVAGRAGVPSGASGVVLNLTVTGNDGPSYVTAWPSQQGQPETSVINLEYANQTIANLVTVPLGVDGAVNLFTVASSHLIADVAGYYVGASSATGGRFVPMTATRVLDTRAPNAFHTGPLGAGWAARVDLNYAAGIPRDALAAVINLTVTNTAGGGFFSAVPRWGDPTGSSSLNVEYAGQTIANQAVVQLNEGWLDVYSSTGGDVIVDVVGWYTGASAESSATGLFVPVAPSRLLDTRAPNAPRFPAKPQSGVPVDVVGSSLGGLPAGAFAAVVLNLTATDSSGYGYATAWGAGLDEPWTSNLNVVRANQTIANHAVVSVSNLGYSLEMEGSAHLLSDVSGYFTGTPPTARPGYTPNGQASPPSSGSHGFLYKVGGTYARWNPCRALTYKVNYVGAPGFARSEVDAAVARVEAATGIDLVNMGDLGGAAGNNGDPAPHGVDAVIAFVNSAENASIGNAAGLGGGGYMPPWNGYAARVVSGFVLINESYNYSQGLGGTGLQGLLLHELGHMMGLDHVQDLAEVMYPVMHSVPNGYGPGDRQGLWYLGAAQGCATMAGSAFAAQSLPGDGSGGGATGAEDLGGQPGVLTAVREGGGQPPAMVSYCSLGQDDTLTEQLTASTELRVAAVATMAPAVGQE